MEWGCMQALIDFDGWRKWKDYSQQKAGDDDPNAAKKALMAQFKSKKSRQKTTPAPATAAA